MSQVSLKVNLETVCVRLLWWPSQVGRQFRLEIKDRQSQLSAVARGFQKLMSVGCRVIVFL